MSLCIGRISYLPSDRKLRETRVLVETKSLQSLLSIKPQGVPVFMIAQNWQEDLALSGEHKQQKTQLFDPLGPAGARNVLLKQFYSSDYDYLLMADDDAALYPYYGVEGLLKDLNSRSADFIAAGVHCIKAIEPIYTPFKRLNAQLPMRDYYMFCQAPMMNGGGLFVIVNVKKHFGKEFYFDESLSVMSMKEREDIDYFIRLMKEKFNVLESRNMIQKNLGFGGDKSTVYSGEKDINATANAAAHNTARKHGIPVVNGRVQFSKVLKFYRGWIKVKRTEPWEGKMEVAEKRQKIPKGLIGK